jgi:sugar phosphate isomerase/epimerase
VKSDDTIESPPHWTRRHVVQSLLASGLVFSSEACFASPSTTLAENPIVAFVKPFSKVPYFELAEWIAAQGFDGIEATVRSGGQVNPNRVEDELPKLCDALAKAKRRVEIATCGINALDQEGAERVLKTIAQCGIRFYRPAYYRYDLKRPIPEQLDKVRKQIAELAAFNREHKLTMVYQNHSGATNVGAPLWDLYSALKDQSPDQIAVALDLAHTTIEGGLSWPIESRLMRPHTAALFMKDFRWQGRKVEWMPLGQGMVDPAFLKYYLNDQFRGPISLHVEYVDDNHPEHISLYRDAFAKDLITLREWMRT